MAAAADLDGRVEPYVLAGKIPVRSAAVLERALRLPPEATQARDWVDLATRLPTERFRDEVSAAAGRVAPSPPSMWKMWMPEDDGRDIRRARRWAMRNECSVLTVAQALGVIARFYLAKHDVRWRRAVRRRLKRGPRTQAAAPTRRVPAEVKREVFERDQDLCQVGLCPDDAFLDLGHLYQPHCEGGPATVENLALQCHTHNDMQHVGTIRVVRHETGPIFLDRHGFVVERERRPDEPRRTLERYLSDLRCGP
jgi:hypothetical protein